MDLKVTLSGYALKTASYYPYRIVVIMRAPPAPFLRDPVYLCSSRIVRARSSGSISAPATASTPAASAAAASCSLVSTSTIVTHEPTSVHVVQSPTLARRPPS